MISDDDDDDDDDDDEDEDEDERLVHLLCHCSMISLVTLKNAALRLQQPHGQ